MNSSVSKNKAVGKISTAKITIIGAALLLISAVLAIGAGSTAIQPDKVVLALLEGAGLAPSGSVPAETLAAVCAIRLPRVLCGVLAGAGLAAAGVVMQGVFRNPLADPGLLGVSSGASLGALIAIMAGAGAFIALPASAFLGALLAVFMILGISLAASGRGAAPPVTLVLGGMAVSAMFNAVTLLVLTASNEYQTSSYMFWTMGGLANRRFEHVFIMAAPVLMCIAGITAWAPRLDVLMLGDEEAHSLGIHPVRTRVAMIVAASLCTAAIVCVSGPIGFVGLMVPHIMRMAVGPSHRRLVVASVFGGGVFLTVCDAFIRLLSQINGREYSVGILTALIGAPYFIYLLMRKGGRGGVF
ncbi:MAG: FecCD family ABC transporter permease [Christensenellales bacterium]|jgi:iron complex transport system permease protein